MSLNFFENIPSVNLTTVVATNGNMYMDMIELADSVSFNKVIMIAGSASVSNSSAFSTTQASSHSWTLSAGYTFSCSFGLYSLNASTLTLVNSASQVLSMIRTTSTTRNTATSLTRSVTASTSFGVSWQTMVTSATSNIAPGNWYLGYFFSTSAGGSSSKTGGGATASGSASVAVTANPYYAANAASINASLYGGNFFAGSYSANTNALPASIHTSNMVKYEAPANNCYVIISS